MTRIRNDLTDFSPAQQSAIKSLERAMAKAREAGLTACGMDNHLLIYDAADLDDAYEELGSLYDAQIACGQGLILKNPGFYRESGGW